MTTRATKRRRVEPLTDVAPNIDTRSTEAAELKSGNVDETPERVAMDADVTDDNTTHASTTPTSVIDHSAYPHIIDQIFMESSEPEGLRLWRQTCKAMKARVDAELYRSITVTIGKNNQVHLACSWASVPASLDPAVSVPESVRAVLRRARVVVLYGSRDDEDLSPARTEWLKRLELVFNDKFPKLATVHIPPNARNSTYLADPPIKARDVCVSTRFGPHHNWAATAHTPRLWRDGTIGNVKIRRYIVNVEIDPQKAWLPRANIIMHAIPQNCETVVILSEKTPPGVKREANRLKTYQKARHPMGICSSLTYDAGMSLWTDAKNVSLTLVGLHELDPRWLGLDVPRFGHSVRPPETPAKAIQRCFLNALARAMDQFYCADKAEIKTAAKKITFLTHRQYIDRVGKHVYASHTNQARG